MYTVESMKCLFLVFNNIEECKSLFEKVAPETGLQFIQIFDCTHCRLLNVNIVIHT